MTELAWRQLRSAIMKGDRFTLPLQDRAGFHLEWDEQWERYINPFDGFPYLLDTDVGENIVAYESSTRTTSHVQISQTIFINNPKTAYEAGVVGDELREYIAEIRRKLERLITKENPNGPNAQGRRLILQVDLQPRKRHWLELTVFPDVQNFDLERINESLDDISSLVVSQHMRFQVFFGIWGCERYNIGLTEQGVGVAV
jgi:hypothetical protein